MTLDNAPTNEPTKSGSGLSRRTVMRGAAISAWAVPAVTLVTAAPAFAASGDLSITSSGTYGQDASVVSYVLAANNETSGAIAGGVVTIRISQALHPAKPVITAPTGWTASTVGAVASSGSWVQTLTKNAAAPIPVGNTIFAGGTITFDEPLASPFVRWDGKSFTLSGTASSNNPATRFEAGMVSAAKTSLRVENYEFARYGAAPNYTYVGARRVFNSGPSTMGKITATVVMPKTDGSGRWSVPGVVLKVHDDWTQVGTYTGTGPWTYTFETRQAFFAPSIASGAGSVDGPNDDSYSAGGVYPSGNQQFYVFWTPQGDISYIGSRGKLATLTMTANSASGPAVDGFTFSDNF